MSKRAIVLLSGGLDSTTMLAMAAAEGFEIFAMSFRYGQRHEVELDAASRQAKRFGAREHRIVEIDLRAFGGSALTDSSIDVPKNRSSTTMASAIPVTYVPARNTVFLSYAVAWAEVLGALDIFIGVNALDNAGYPDCRPEYLQAFERMANLATRAAVEGRRLSIRAPLITMPKVEILRRGLELDVDFAHTSSCYDPSPSGAACGRCDSCLLRLQAFESIGRDDPRPRAASGEA